MSDTTKRPTDPFARIPNTDCEYVGTVLELPGERDQCLAAELRDST